MYFSVNLEESFTVFNNKELAESYMRGVKNAGVEDVYMDEGDDLNGLLVDLYGEELTDRYGDKINVEEFMNYISEKGSCHVEASRGEFWAEYMHE